MGESHHLEYLGGMLVHKRKNRSGSTSVVVVDKSSGKFKELICLGPSSDESEIETMVGLGKVNGALYSHKYKGSDERLIVVYSDSRAAKDNHNRERGIARLRRMYASGSLSKDKLTKRGASSLK